MVVDDGINYGKTIRALILYCRAAGELPMGVMVLDNRLGGDDSDRIASHMAEHPIISLYTWKSSAGSL